jgi:transposase
MKYYAGLDVSLDSTALCIVNQDGDIIHESEVLSEPEAIDGWLKDKGLPMERVGLEAGATSPWLCHALLALRWPAICIETRHAKAAMAAQNVKTDRNDARGIAHIMRAGWFRAVHVKSHESRKLRVLLGNRRCLLDKQLDLQNQIRGTIKVFGLKVGKVTTATYDRRIRELIDDHRELQNYIVPMLEVLRHLVEQTKRLEKMILQYVRQDQVCKLFMTIPGVGPLTALAFKTFVDSHGRFKHSRSVGAALGLTPRKYASGEVDYDGRITKCGDTFVRSHLFEAAKVLLARAAKNNTLKAWGLRVARRSSRKNACVAVARRLAVIMHAMWRDGTVFQAGDTECQTEAVAA